MVYNVEALRGFAAVSVSLYHFRVVLNDVSHPVANFLSQVSVYGALGLDLFFIISGFVMVVASDRSGGGGYAAMRFAIRRLFRIVPLYWFATGVSYFTYSVAFARAPCLDVLMRSLSFQYVDIKSFNVRARGCVWGRFHTVSIARTCWF